MSKQVPSDLITSVSALRDLKSRPKTRQETVKLVLGMTACIPDATIQQLRELFPEINKTMTIEEIMTIMVVNRVIKFGDVAAYTALMDSAYGKSNQNINISDGNISKIKMPAFLEIESNDNLKNGTK